LLASFPDWLEPVWGLLLIAELERLRESDTVRVIDALAVYKDAAGELEVEHLSNLSRVTSADEAVEPGSKVGALVGLGIDGEEGMQAGAAVAAAASADGVDVFSGQEWDVLEDIPNDSAAALLLLELHWAIPFRDEVEWADEPVAIGLLSAEEAREQHATEQAANPSAG
jgi:uncharacterized membrane protein